MMERRNNLLVAALAGACSVGCVPDVGLLDTSNSCEETGVRTTNPYDMEWTLKIKKARVSIDAASGGLPHNPVRFQTYEPASLGGDLIERTGWARYRTSFDQSYAQVQFDSDILVRGSFETVMGGSLEEIKAGDSGAPLRLELWDDGGWLGIGINQERLGCDLRIDPAALVNAHNSDTSVIVGSRLVSDPQDAIVLSPETVGCPWLLHAELEIEAQPDLDRYRDLYDVEITESADCTSLAAADAYDYQMTIATALLDASNEDLAEYNILDPAPQIHLSYWGRKLDIADGTEADDYEPIEVGASGGGFDPLYYLEAGHSPRDYPGLQIDHLTGEKEQYQARLRIYDILGYVDEERFGEPDNHYTYANCTFALDEQQVLDSVNKNAEMGEDGETRWLHIGPGNGLDCTGPDGTAQGLASASAGEGPLVLAFTPRLKFDVGGGKVGDEHFGEIDFAQEHPEEESDDVTTTEAGPLAYDPDAPDRCQPYNTRSYNCNCAGVEANPYFRCVVGGAVSGDTLPESAQPTAVPADDDEAEEDEADEEEVPVEEPEVEEGPSADDPAECCMAEGGCNEGVVPTGDCAPEPEEEEEEEEEEAADPCQGNPCGTGGTCKPKGTVYSCDCVEGYSDNGTTCVDADGCAGDPCEGDAECTDVAAGDGGGYTCECPAGTEGDTCTEVNSCASTPCYPGVECTDLAAPENGFTCGDCPAGFEGNGEQCIPAGNNDGQNPPETDIPDLSDDDGSGDDAPTTDDAPPQMTPISGCACNGSDSRSSRGTALLLFAALLLVWRRRRGAQKHRTP